MPPKKRKSSSKPGSTRAKRVAGTASTGGSRLRAAANGARTGLTVLWRSATALLFVAIVIGWLLGRGPLERAVASVRGGAPEVHIDWVGAPGTGDVNIDQLPMTIDTMVRAELEQIVGDDPFDRAALHRARDRLLDTGWFAEVGEIRRVAGNRVLVSGVVARREAAVLVQSRAHGRGEHVIDRFGVPLELPADVSPPPELFRVFNPTMMPKTITMGGRSRIDRREAWRGADVEAALDLLAFIDQEAGYSIQGVDLSAYSSRGELRLITDRGGALVWGGPVGSAHAGEVSDERKLAHLRLVLAEGDRLDRPGELIELFREVVQVVRTPRRP
ncbi:MAG: hypothetical protein AAGI30_08670 [Planctomycetota bacterium]